MVLPETLIRMEYPSVLALDPSQRLLVQYALIDQALATLWSSRSFGCFPVREPWEAVSHGPDAGSKCWSRCEVYPSAEFSSVNGRHEVGMKSSEWSLRLLRRQELSSWLPHPVEEPENGIRLAVVRLPDTEHSFVSGPGAGR